jgi:hypothetical protein
MTEETLIVFFTTRYQHAQRKKAKKKKTLNFFSFLLLVPVDTGQRKNIQPSRRPSSSQAARPSSSRHHLQIFPVGLASSSDRLLRPDQIRPTSSLLTARSVAATAQDPSLPLPFAAPIGSTQTRRAAISIRPATSSSDQPRAAPISSGSRPNFQLSARPVFQLSARPVFHLSAQIRFAAKPTQKKKRIFFTISGKTGKFSKFTVK